MIASTTAGDAALELLAACQSLPITVAERVIDVSVLDALEHARLIEVVPRASGVAGVVRIAEGAPTVEIGTVRRRTHLRSIAAALRPEDVDAVPPDAAVALGVALAEADLCIGHIVRRSVRAALVRADVDTAIDLATFGLRHTPGDPELVHLLAMSHEAVGRHGTAAVVGSGSAEHDAAWLGRWAINRFLSTGETPDLLGTSAVDDRHNEMFANEVWIQALDGDVDAVAASVRKVLDDPRSSPQAVVWVCVAGAVPAALDGRPTVVRRLIDQARTVLAHQAATLTPFAPLQIELAAFLASARLGDTVGLDEIIDANTAEGAPELLAAAWSCFAGNVDRELGRFVLGMSRFERGLATFDHDPFGLTTWARSELDVCRAMLGVGTGAQALALADAGDGFGLYTSCLQRNAAWIAAAGGDLRSALQRTERAIEIAADRRQNAHHALALLDLARFGQPRRAESMLTELTAVESPLVRIAVESVLALASDEPGRLAGAAVNARHAGVEPLASELGARAITRAARTGRAADRARLEIVLDVSGGPTPILRAGPVDPVLTGREREIARLAASGQSSRSIADGLALSTRTVDNLLGRVYTKAGLAGRAELVELCSGRASTRPDPI
jgi:DNA-binding CsgD family transcriptional regulator